MADDRAGASTTANASGGNREQVPSPAPLLSAVSEKRPFIRRRCIRRPTYGIHHTPDWNLPKKGSRRPRPCHRSVKSPSGDSCMRELNAAQSPLTMGNCAQPEMTGSRFDCPGSESLGAPQISNKKPLPAAGAHNRFVVADGLRGRGIWRNSIQAVVAHHLEDDVDQHSSDVALPPEPGLSRVFRLLLG